MTSDEGYTRTICDVTIRREGQWLVLTTDVDGREMSTQAEAGKDNAEAMIREAIGAVLDAPEDSFDLEWYDIADLLGDTGPAL